MRLIEANKVEQAIKDYWKAQVDKALTLTDGNEKRINIYLEHNHELLKAIDELPSVEQDTITHDSIPAETGKNDGDRTSGDCISRTQAIDMLDEQIEQCEKALYNWLPEKDRYAVKVEKASLTAYREKLKYLPSVQPERKTGRIGRWLPDNTDYYRTKFICSACGESEEVPTTGFGYGTMWDYCPMCGAKMERGEQE